MKLVNTNRIGGIYKHINRNHAKSDPINRWGKHNQNKKNKTMKTLAQIQQDGIKQNAKAIARYNSEMKEMKIQAAWMMRCVKVKHDPFPTIEKEYSVWDGRVWHWNAAPAYLELGLDEFLSYVISQMLHHGSMSEEHEVARATLRFLLRKDGKRTQIH